MSANDETTELYSKMSANDENVLNKGRIEQKNVKIFAGKENFEGGHKKGLCMLICS